MLKTRRTLFLLQATTWEVPLRECPAWKHPCERCLSASRLPGGAGSRAAAANAVKKARMAGKRLRLGLYLGRRRGGRAAARGDCAVSLPVSEASGRVATLRLGLLRPRSWMPLGSEQKDGKPTVRLCSMFCAL